MPQIKVSELPQITAPEGVDSLLGLDSSTGISGQVTLSKLREWMGGKLLSGTVDPGPEVGLNGDGYINTSTKMFFGPKAGGSWGPGIQLEGGGGASLIEDDGVTQPQREALNFKGFKIEDDSINDASVIQIADALTDKALYYYDSGTKVLKPVEIGANNQVLLSKPSLTPPYQWATPSGTWWSREVLFANRTYYVRTDGNDSNNGLTNTSGGAFLTIQKAIDIVASLDISIFNVTIEVADGTYSQGIVLKTPVGSGSLRLRGNVTTPSNVTLSTGNNNCFLFVQRGAWIIEGFRLTNTGMAGSISVVGGGIVYFSNIDFGPAGAIHINSTNGSTVEAVGNYSVSGGSSIGSHWYAISFGSIRANGRTVTITNNPSFAAGWLWCDRGLGFFDVWSMTFSGSATGKRYTVNNNGVAFVNGASATYLPGNVSGTVANGGYYG